MNVFYSIKRKVQTISKTLFLFTATDICHEKKLVCEQFLCSHREREIAGKSYMQPGGARKPTYYISKATRLKEELSSGMPSLILCFQRGF